MKDRMTDAHIAVILIAIIVLMLFSGCTKELSKKYDEAKDTIKNSVTQGDSTIDAFEMMEKTYKEGQSYISSKEDIKLTATDKSEKHYNFTYNDEVFEVTYSKDNWHIKDSYKIKNKADITLICQALIDIYPIHGKDMKSYRTAEDMMDEWVRHNIANDYVPESSPWKERVQSVDLNPADQGKSLKELYESRANKQLL